MQIPHLSHSSRWPDNPFFTSSQGKISGLPEASFPLPCSASFFFQMLSDIGCVSQSVYNHTTISNMVSLWHPVNNKVYKNNTESKKIYILTQYKKGVAAWQFDGVG